MPIQSNMENYDYKLHCYKVDYLQVMTEKKDG